MLQMGNKMLQNVINGNKCLAIGSTRLEFIGKYYRNGNNDFKSLKVLETCRNMVKNDKNRNKMLQNVTNGHKCLAIGSTRVEIIGKHYRNGNNDFKSLQRF